jgi:hypothetical protein
MGFLDKIKNLGREGLAPTPEQKKYAKEAKKAGKDSGLDEKDMARIDANQENAARKGELDSKFPGITREEIIKMVANSNLSMDTSNHKLHTTIWGKVKGHDVRLSKEGSLYPSPKFTEATIDGVALTPEEAEDLFKKYSPIAEDRQKRMSETIKKRQQQEWDAMEAAKIADLDKSKEKREEILKDIQSL